MPSFLIKKEDLKNQKYYFVQEKYCNSFIGEQKVYSKYSSIISIYLNFELKMHTQSTPNINNQESYKNIFCR
jgi:hypothetical protein